MITVLSAAIRKIVQESYQPSASRYESMVNLSKCSMAKKIISMRTAVRSVLPFSTSCPTRFGSALSTSINAYPKITIESVARIINKRYFSWLGDNHLNQERMLCSSASGLEDQAIGGSV